MCSSPENTVDFSQALLSWVPSLHLSGLRGFLSLRLSCDSFCSPPLLWGRKQECTFRHRAQHSHTAAHERPIYRIKGIVYLYGQNTVASTTWKTTEDHPKSNSIHHPNVSRYSVRVGLKWDTFSKDLWWDWTFTSGIIILTIKSSQRFILWICVLLNKFKHI